MSTFDDRQAAFEAKFARDEHTQFLIRMRRNRLMAVWASAIRGDTVEEAVAYGEKLISTDLHHVSEEQIIEAVKSYLGDRSDEDTIRKKMVEMLNEAKKQMANEQPD